MTEIGADTNPGTESCGLPMTAEASEFVDETFGGSKAEPDAETGAWTGADAGTVTRVEAGV